MSARLERTKHHDEHREVHLELDREPRARSPLRLSTWNWTVTTPRSPRSPPGTGTDPPSWTPRDPRDASPPQFRAPGAHLERTNIMTNTANSTWNWTITGAAASLHLELDRGQRRGRRGLHLELELILRAVPHALRATRQPPQFRALGAHLERTNIMTNTANSTWNWNITSAARELHLELEHRRRRPSSTWNWNDRRTAPPRSSHTGTETLDTAERGTATRSARRVTPSRGFPMPPRTELVSGRTSRSTKRPLVASPQVDGD